MGLVVRKPAFCICENKDADQLRGYTISFAVTAKLISAFVFATWIVQFLIYLNPKFQASSHLLWLYSPVCVGPGQKPRRPIFSQRGSNNGFLHTRCFILRQKCFSCTSDRRFFCVFFFAFLLLFFFFFFGGGWGLPVSTKFNFCTCMR